MKTEDIAWFRPLWKRIAVTAVVAVWCALEWVVFRDQLFAGLTAVALIYAIWTLFVRFPKDDATGPGNSPPR